MLQDLTFGQYYETTSFVHKLDPRIKILLLIAYIVFVFVAKSFYGLLALSLFLIIATIFSKVQLFDMLKSINSHSKAVVQMTLTTYDDSLCRIIEPNVSPTSERSHALEIFRDAGIPSS